MTACPHEPARAGVLIRTWEVLPLIEPFPIVDIGLGDQSLRQ